MANETMERARRLYAEARALLTEKGTEAGAVERAQKLMAEADELKRRAVQLEELLARAETGLAQDMRQPPEQASREREFRSYDEYLQEVWRALNPRLQVLGHTPDPRLRWFADEPEPGETKTMTEAVGASGGFLVPQEFRAELLAIAAEQSIVRPRATVIRMSRRQVSVPVVDQTTTTAGRPHWFGGMAFYWAEEASEKTSTDALFRQVVLTAHKLIGYTTASDELVQDSAISLADFLSGPLGFAGGAAWMEDYYFLRGTGNGQPLGVLNAGATVTVPRQDEDAVSFTDLANMREAFLPSGRGVWVISQSLMSEIIQLNGPTGNPSYVWGDPSTGVPNRLLDFPIIWTEKLPAKGTAGDVVLADFRYYLIGDRQATTIESTQFDLWRYDKTSWRLVHRVDGRPWLSAPLTLSDGTTQVSPFVILGGD